jgi:Uma2 family endonuclease
MAIALTAKNPDPNFKIAADSDRLSQRSHTVVLPNITWQTYQALRKELGETHAPHLAYDRGQVEITMPSDLHETINCLMKLIVTALAAEFKLKVKGFGSTSLEREDLEAGIQPDSCFYLQNSDRIKGRSFDIQHDPPPDLAIEVDITSSSKQRLSIYQRLGVPEIWRYTLREIAIYQLNHGEYKKCDFSPTFPILSGQILQTFLLRSESLDDNEFSTFVREWAQTQKIHIQA